MKLGPLTELLLAASPCELLVREEEKMFQKIKLLRALILVTIPFLIISCGQSPTPESELLEAVSKVPVENRTPFVITLGGWNTCRAGSEFSGNPIDGKVWDIAKNFQSQVELHYGKNAQWMILCYSYYKQSVAGKGRFLSHKNPDSYQRASPSETVSFIRQVVKEHPNTDVYIVGFSYGGWLALTIAEELGGTMNIPLLATLDPISQSNCNMVKFITNWFSGGYEGCQGFPTDFEELALQKISETTGAWFNYYQLDYSQLHSGESEYADVNRQVFTTYSSNYAHNVVMNHPRIWNDQEGNLDGQMPTSDPIAD